MKKWRPEEMFEIENSGGRTNLPQKKIVKKLGGHFQLFSLQSVNLTCTSFFSFTHNLLQPIYLPTYEKTIPITFSRMHNRYFFVFS